MLLICNYILSADDYVDPIIFEGGPMNFAERKAILETIYKTDSIQTKKGKKTTSKQKPIPKKIGIACTNIERFICTTYSLHYKIVRKNKLEMLLLKALKRMKVTVIVNCQLLKMTRNPRFEDRKLVIQ